MINIIINFIRRRPKFSLVLIGFGLMFIVGVILNETLPSANQSVSYINPSPVDTEFTSTPSADTPSRYPNPTSVVWTSLSDVPTLDQVLSLYDISINPLSQQNLTYLSKQLGFNSAPTETKTKYINLIGWTNNNFHLDADRNESSITFGYNDINQVTALGEFNSTDQLFEQTTSLLKLSDLFDPRITFTLETTLYTKTSIEWLTIANPEEASFLTLIITPQIGSYPIYMQGKNFIEATYNRQNQLIKLIVHDPIYKLNPSGQTNLISFDALEKKPSSFYFRLFVKPKTNHEFQNDSYNIPTLYPNSVTTGYYLSEQHLEPIHIVRNTDNYLYATFARVQP